MQILLVAIGKTSLNVAITSCSQAKIMNLDKM